MLIQHTCFTKVNENGWNLVGHLGFTPFQLTSLINDPRNEFPGPNSVILEVLHMNLLQKLMIL